MATLRLPSLLAALIALVGCTILQRTTPVPPSLAHDAPVLASQWLARTEKTRPEWTKHVRSHLSEVPPGQPGGTVFVGDSHVAHWMLVAAFPGERLHNRGIPGDTIAGVLERIDPSVTLLAPRRVFVMIGANDVFQWTRKETFIGRYHALLLVLRARLPEAEIHVIAIPPVNRPHTIYTHYIRTMNRTLARLARRRGAQFHDVHRRLAGPRGLLRPEHSLDGIHLTPAAYEVMAEMIRPSLE